MADYANPILRGMYPDPSVCRVGDTYYLVNSTFEYLPGIPIHSSTDLVNWQLVGHAIHRPEQFDYSAVRDSRGMFAPTLRHHDGVFYLVCTQMEAGEVSGNFYVTATDIAGPWSDPVMLPDALGIDPSLFFHDGRAWWIGCREVLEQQFEGETEIWMRELDLQRGELVGPETVIWNRTQFRAVWAEGPHLYERNGWFYLLTAEGGTAFDHSVMVARSRDLAGPYLPCRHNPILTHRHFGHDMDVQYVGHADLVEAEDGQWWMTMLATRQIVGHHILGRETHLARVTWEDDWPVVNAGLGRLESPVARPGRWGSDGVPVASDFLSVRGFATFAEPRPNGLLLRSTGSEIGSMRPSAALLRRLSSTRSTVTVTLEQFETDAPAGLILRQSDDFHVRVEVLRLGERQRVDLVVRQGDDLTVGSTALPLGPIELSARVDGSTIGWAAGVPDGERVQLGSTPAELISTETAGGFVGVTFGPYVSGAEGASVLFTAWSQEDRA